MELDLEVKATYIAVSNTELKKLENRERKDPDNPEEDLVGLLEELKKTSNSLEIRTMWDALHYVMTGIASEDPIEDDEKSELIVGVVPIVYEVDDFVSATNKEDSQRIVDKMKEINFDDFLEKLDFKKMDKAHIYPNWEDYQSGPKKHLWKEQNKEEVWSKLKSEFEKLVGFYNENKDLTIFVTIV